MKGHIRERSPGHWAIVIDVRDPHTGQRKRKWHSFKGTKKEAQVEKAKLIADLNRGSYVERSKTTVADFVRSRIDQWEAAEDISARTAQRYRELTENQIAPHIGAKPVQKLTRLDVEGWHTSECRSHRPHYRPRPPRSRQGSTRRREGQPRHQERLPNPERAQGRGGRSSGGGGRSRFHKGHTGL
jgi:hypothetical protein